MRTANLELSLKINDTWRKSKMEFSADGDRNAEPTLPAAIAATTWTKADPSNGTAVLPAEHGIETNDVCAVFWADGWRYGLTATVQVNSVALAGGAGSELPANGTAVVVAKRVPVDLAFAGNRTSLFEFDAAARALVVLLDDEETAIDEAELLPNYLTFWADDMNLPNPYLDATIASAWAFNGALSPNAVQLYVLCDVTP